MGTASSTSFFFPLPRPRPLLSASPKMPSKGVSTLLRMVHGTMPCSIFHASCTVRRRVVSSIAACMERVILSAYKITCPCALRAARPKVWISEPSERKKPSLSASKMATKDTSGKSKPSRKRLIPTSTSNSPRRKAFKICIRSKVSMSECK